jgi:hypothetical protein
MQETAAGGAIMRSFTARQTMLAGSILASLIVAPSAPAVAQKAGPPDFSSNNVGWVGLNGNGPFFEAVPGTVPPVTQDPAHPFVPNGTGRQPTFRIGDLSNPIKAVGERGHEEGQR